MGKDNFETQYHPQESELKTPSEKQITQEMIDALRHIAEIALKNKQKVNTQLENISHEEKRLLNESSNLEVRKQTVEKLRSAAEILGYKLPETTTEYPEDDFRTQWRREEAGYRVQQRTVDSIQERVGKRALFEALAIILGHQETTILDLIQQWPENNEELIEIAKKLRPQTEESEFEQKVVLVKQTIIEILKQSGQPQSLHILRGILKREKFTYKVIDPALKALATSVDKELIAGWCFNARRYSNGRQGNRVVFKLPEQEIHIDATFFPGMSKEKVNEMIDERILKIISENMQPMTSKQIIFIHNEHFPSNISEQVINNHLVNLVYNEVLEKAYDKHNDIYLYQLKEQAVVEQNQELNAIEPS